MIIPDSPAKQPELDSEEWRIIPFATSYEVSSHGRIRRTEKARNAVVGKILKLTPDKDGYLQFISCNKGKRLTVKVHRAVLFAFKGASLSSGHISSHEDGDKTNNFVRNLEWRTQPENLKLKIKHGTHGRGLKVDQVRSIRAMRDRGHTYKQISEFHSVSFSAVAHVVKRRTWAHDNP